MSSVSKKLVIFGAEYLIVLEALLFFVIAFQKATIEDTVRFIVVGGSLIGCSLLVAHLLKKLFHKKRPPKTVELFVPGDVYAFPSEHATSLSALTVIIFYENVLYGVVVLVVGLIILSCRVLARVHRVEDMIVGSILGLSVSYGLITYGTSFIAMFL